MCWTKLIYIPDRIWESFSYTNDVFLKNKAILSLKLSIQNYLSVPPWATVRCHERPVAGKAEEGGETLSRIQPNANVSERESSNSYLSKVKY